jgi:phosphopentomutase
VAHSPENLPILLAGRGLSGEHRALPAMPFANLCLAVAQSFGVETTTFGLDGTTPATPL